MIAVDARACLPLFNELIFSLQGSPVPGKDDVKNFYLGIIGRREPLLHCSKNVFTLHVYSVIKLVSTFQSPQKQM